ncbi:structure-specific endonuclease subunit SLX4 isoform X4 [Lates calcarifer]|uniref:Structure-specific endonuclease subunit SLX4 n=1 Tax=Lates calcarifer TaxID=8187 RepID=A0AAJ7PPM4_LATCA|nr:structure-specific endonuclease subunit SLX4 isoform X4 [Lates calcarifer]
MDDSDQDFADLCSKLLKRVRKKPGESRQPRKAEQQPSSPASEGTKRRRNGKKTGDSGSKITSTQSVRTGASQRAASRGTGCDSGDAGSSAALSAAAAAPSRGLRAKDKVLLRMQQFKRESPQRMTHKNQSQPTNQENDSGHHPQPQKQAGPPSPLRADPPQPCSSNLQVESDEALALKLQQELDREAAEAETVDLEDGGLFFCQICHRDLSHMTPDGRTQHLNRCLDKSEESAPAAPPPPPPPGVPDCPICGKKFKSQKSRSAHLKRCSSDLGVPPAVLLEALQRQAEETQNALTTNTLAQTGGTKRKAPPKPGLPVRKKPRKKTDPLDEDTMVALALSSSMLEQEREAGRKLQTEIAASHTSMAPELKWRPDAGKGRGKKKKGAVPRPPPLLLVQDAQEALVRLQERVSALLLRTRPPTPPTPTCCPSSLPGCSGAAPLWEKSALLNSSSTCLSDFYTPELREFITPWESTTTNKASSSDGNRLESSLQPVSEGTPVTRTRSSILPSSAQTVASSPAPSTPGTGQLPVGSQTLRDLMEVAEDGMTLTQCGYTTSGPDKDKQSRVSLSTNLHLSGFVLEEAEEQADLCSSGFLPETIHTLSEDTRSRDQPRADMEQGSHRSVALSRLASNLSSMVNNPQLSDLQLQVDSGEVYFAHSFMVYARCPLLAEMVHESGFGVREEGMPAAQRVLMSDVPGQAVFTLLQYLYTAHCSIPASLRPHVLELASRFDMQELQQLCELHQEEADDMNHEENVNDQTGQAFIELLRSMWTEEDEEDEGTDTDGAKDEERGSEENGQTDDVTSGEREICEEQVNEEELEEIYEFAATQRKREEEKNSVEEEEKVDDGEDGEEVLAELTEPKKGLSEKTPKLSSQLEPDPSLDRSCSRLFTDSWGVYEEKDPSSSSSSTSGLPKTHTSQSQRGHSSHKPSCKFSSRTLLHSSPSLVDDLFPSPPHSTSNLPIPGLSPAQLGNWGGGGGDKGTDAAEWEAVKESPSLKRESQGPRSICVAVSPGSPSKKEEPELIVLSDSSEEMEVDLAVLSSRSPSPRSPCTVQNLQSYTRIKPQSVPRSTGPTVENRVFSSLEFSPGDPPAASVQRHPGSGCEQSPVDCSPEVSWLIPSTPVQPGRCSSSTQTKSSMCRTRLFPKGDSSSPSSASSSPGPRLHNRLKTSSSGTRASAHAGPTESSVPRLKPDEAGPNSSSLDLSFSPKGKSNYNSSKSREEFAAPLCQPKFSHLSSSTHCHPLQASLNTDTPLHIQPQPHSSTPLHTELDPRPVLPAASPLHSSLKKQRSNSQGRDRAPSESPEKTELVSFHLSPLSDPSDLPSSSSHRGLQSSQRHSKSSSESGCSVESSSQKRTGIRNEEGEGETECQNKDTCDEGEQEEAEEEGRETEVAESSFRQSFMDEPPIAFNDSWGLDACVEANPGCFSLRLEDSTGSNQQEHSQGQRDAPRSSSSTDCPSPPMNSSPSKTHSAPPIATIQARTSSSFTPTPPNPNNSFLDSKIWDSWVEEDAVEALPLSQRVNPSAQLKTPVSSRSKKRRSLVPITPMPHYSDMDTPELKNKLNRFGVRPLPKRQMILKLKEIHQYTHQLVSSDSEDEALTTGRAAQKPPSTTSAGAGSRLVSCARTVTFKEPRAPAAMKHKGGEGEEELLSASQGSNTSSTAASEESERSNPVLCLSSDGDSDSDGGVSASQAANRLQDRLQAVRSFILSDSGLYSQILQYQPLVLSQLQERLKAAGIRLGAARLVDYLDSQCITFTTAKPGHPAPSRRHGKKTKTAGERGAKRKKVVTAMI